MRHRILNLRVSRPPVNIMSKSRTFGRRSPSGGQKSDRWPGGSAGAVKVRDEFLSVTTRGRHKTNSRVRFLWEAQRIPVERKFVRLHREAAATNRRFLSPALYRIATSPHTTTVYRYTVDRWVEVEMGGVEPPSRTFSRADATCVSGALSAAATPHRQGIASVSQTAFGDRALAN